MFKHYLKTAIRNLKSNSAFNAISIVCMALGIVIFAVLEYEVDNEMFFDRRLPEKGRIVETFLEQRYEDGTPDTVPCYDPKMPQQFESPAIAYVFSTVFDPIYGENYTENTYSNLVLTGPDGSSYSVTCQFDNIMPDYFKPKGLTLLYGSRLPQNGREVVVKESLLEQLSIKGDPTEYILEYTSPEGTTMHQEQLHIVNVIKDDKWSRRIKADIFYNVQSLWRVFAVLNDGVDIDEANRMLKDKQFAKHTWEGNRLIVPQVRPVQKNPVSREEIWKRILSVLVLIIGMICFMSNLINTFIRNWHNNHLRICLGSKRSGLFGLLSCQILVTLIPATVIALISAFFLIPFLNTLNTRIVYYHLPYILLLELSVSVFVFILCMVAVFIAVRHMDISAPDRKNTLSHKELNLLKYALLTVEMSLSVMALSSSLSMISSVPRPYCPLSRSQLKQILTLDMRNGSFEQSRDIIQSKIRSISDVEDVLMTTVPIIPTVEEEYHQARVWQFRDNEGGYAYYPIFIYSDTSYFSFFNIPVERMEYDRSIEGIYVSEKLWKAMDGKYPRVLDMTVPDDYHYENPIKCIYAIAGVFERPMGDLNDYDDGYFLGPFNSQNPGLFLYVKVREGANVNSVISRIEDICEEVTGSPCRDKIGTMGGKWLGSSHSTRITIMLYAIAACAGMLMVLLSIMSIITTETGARRKDVSLRKIHGAKASDIARMFIRPYLWVLLVSFLIGYPCSRFLYVSDNEQLLSWRIPLVLLITALIMTLSTVWKIRKIMHTNPTDILKE